MRIGEIHFTGNEESGQCWFCGGDLPKRRRRWCCDQHKDEYWNNYNYAAASKECWKRSEHTCENCHKPQIELTREFGWESINSRMEIHHIIPLEGDIREWNVLNRQDNLIALCHQCHLKAHAAIREPKKAGQLVLL